MSAEHPSINKNADKMQKSADPDQAFTQMCALKEITSQTG